MFKIVTQDIFKQHRREKLLDYGYYKDEAEDLIARINEIPQYMADDKWMADKDEADRMSMTRARAEYFVDILELNYSAGDSLDNLRVQYLAAVESWELYDQCTRAFDATIEGKKTSVANFSLYDTEFALVNRMVAGAVLLGWPQLLPRLLPVIDHHNPRDALLERIFQYYGVRNGKNFNECTRHLPYFKALKIFDSPNFERASLVKKYLADWYRASRREPYYDSHKPGRIFRGYWAWEAAVITLILNIDDGSYRNDRFYPADAVQFAKQCQLDYAPTGLPSINQNELRAKASDQCPKTGLWESLDTPSQTVRFEADQQMGDLKSVYGLTVWRFQQ